MHLMGYQSGSSAQLRLIRGCSVSFSHSHQCSESGGVEKVDLIEPDSSFLFQLKEFRIKLSNQSIAEIDLP